MKYKQVQYMIIREEQANVMLIEKLRSFRKYINEDMSDWEQLIAVGGFIADVIRLIKWDKYRKLFSTSSSCGTYAVGNTMTCSDIIKELWTAIDYEINSPHADELNTIWNKWNSDVNYFHDIENISDIYEVIISKMEEYHPGFMNCADTYFHFSDL